MKGCDFYSRDIDRKILALSYVPSSNAKYVINEQIKVETELVSKEITIRGLLK
jgi:hypothetical protein